MRHAAATLVLAATIAIPTNAFCQLPPDAPLSPSDSILFDREIHRLEKLLETAGDRDAVMMQLAGTWATGGQYRQAMELLGKVVARGVGLDPSNDVDFANLRGTREFAQLLQKVRDDTPPVLNSRIAFTATEPGLVPEGIAWSASRKQFYLGSTYKPKIVACTGAGKCRPFVPEGLLDLAGILGVRVDPNDGSLWAATNGETESAVWHFTVPSGKAIGKYPLSHKTESHELNDLVVNSRGDVYVTDTRAGTVYRITHRTDRLEALSPAPGIPEANGIAVSDDGRYLYVAGFGDGITVVDLKTGSFRAISHPGDLCLASIDGLYFYRRSLVAIQNGLMVHRVIRCYLTQGPDRIGRFDVLERRNPLMETITTGAIANGAFYFMTGSQIGQLKPGLNPVSKPVTILKLSLAQAGSP